MTPLFQAVIHTATQFALKKERATAASRSGRFVVILFYGMLLALILLVVWLAKPFW